MLKHPVKFISTITVFVFLCLTSFAQQKPEEVDITGLWKGELYNDTTQMYLPYELAISMDEKGKLSGYSYTAFKIDDHYEVGIKELNIKRTKDKILIEDKDLLSNSYTVEAPKGVKQRCVLDLTIEDTTMVLSGKWSTNRTKRYLPLTGTMIVKRKNEIKKSELVKHLDTLHVSNDLSFITPEEKRVYPPTTMTDAEIAKQEKKEEKQKEELAKQEEKKTKELAKEAEKQQKASAAAAAAATAATATTVAIAKSKPSEAKPIPKPAAEVTARKTVVAQTVYYKADSLTFTLYDNGEIDGDTVTVLMNNNLLFSKQGLSTKANSKTIHIDPNGSDSIHLVLYAETLGSIPPNTGLLVIRDGESIYEVRFSADLQTNSDVILRRKPKGN